MIDRSAAGSTVVGSLEELFEESGSGVADDTDAVFVTEGTAAFPTPTVTLTAESAPEERGPGLVQETSWPDDPEQSQPTPLAEEKLSPAGSVSVTVMGPCASSGPALWTANVYVPCPPAVKSPM